jgi:hypothetical protein
MRASDIASEVFHGTVSEAYVRRVVAPEHRMRPSHSVVVWQEAHVAQWYRRHFRDRGR